MIDALFHNFSHKFRKENDLSNVTWVICQTSESFKQLFLRFFFPEIEFKKINSFERELSKDNSRADFVIDNDGVTFVIECKINDTNHHFDQYTKAYNIPPNRLGYIVNYDLQVEGFSVKTWYEFYDFIKNNIPEDDGGKLYKGYLEYLKNVCGIIIISKRMELKEIYSLYAFNIILKSAVNRNIGYANLTFYNADFKERYYGNKFKVEIEDKDDLWLNIGVWFDRENPVITIGAWDKEGWGKPFCNKLRIGINHNPIYANQHYWEDSTYYFEATDKFYYELETADDVEQQKKVLCNFIDEVILFYSKI